jgi:hypothetical protein
MLDRTFHTREHRHRDSKLIFFSLDDGVQFGKDDRWWESRCEELLELVGLRPYHESVVTGESGLGICIL